jgi:hypothetical protein
LVLSLQFGTEMNWPHSSIKLSVNLCDSYSIHHRLDVIDVLTDCFSEEKGKKSKKIQKSLLLH